MSEDPLISSLHLAWKAQAISPSEIKQTFCRHRRWMRQKRAFYYDQLDSRP